MVGLLIHRVLLLSVLLLSVLLLSVLLLSVRLLPVLPCVLPSRPVPRLRARVG
ncbi:hypothetical protein [Streptomyces sp. AB3(2024)]|uniref:hypothetical protein n=1 Tax=Streptomyces sp. AB3(2024) TaxID=3317321 RepID=UPI0035A371E7